MSAETANDKDEKTPAQQTQASDAKPAAPDSRPARAKRTAAAKPAAPTFSRRRVWPD